MKNREEKEMIIAFERYYEELNTKNHHPTLHVLDNKCSGIVKEYIISKRTYLPFVEPYNHRVNATKHGCKTVKYHTISMLCITELTYPIKLWD